MVSVKEQILRVDSKFGPRHVQNRTHRRFLGTSATSFTAALLDLDATVVPDEFLAAFRHQLLDVFSRELRAVEGAAELVASLDVPYCVASNSSRVRLIFSLKQTGLFASFEGRKGDYTARTTFERNYIAAIPARVEGVRNQIVTVVGLVALAAVIEPAVSQVAPAVGRFGPLSGAPGGVLGGSEASTLLAPGLALAILVAWALAAFAAAAWRLNRRDLV